MFSKETSCHAFILVYFLEEVSRYQTKQTLAATLLFQCNFLLVVGADNLI